ncbi:MAG TPA: DNA replication/repair protein RecF [Patescibacteria group bacterium]|jgi:DNA replication and repair protein RecF|nr:DNA replication/repair protein RecF [Patescibacteria group bacterium]
MGLRKISLKNFRNYSNLSLALDANLVLILGENASGKTNLIESIYFLSNLKSFRVADNFLVKDQEDFFSIEGQTEQQEMEVVVQTNPTLKRSYKIDGAKVKRPLWQSFATVLFAPTDLNLFILGPSFRRRFLDEALTQVKKDYSADLASLDHVLSARATLLSEIFQRKATESELDFWDEQLAALTLRISLARSEFLSFLNKQMSSVYQNITGFNSKFLIEYKSAANDITLEAFREKIKAVRAAEMQAGLNLAGPHRDDFTVKKDGQLNINNSSRGELRSQILTLKFLQAQFLSSYGRKPIILLDDVFSELDEARRTNLLNNLTDHQVFITSTEEHHLPRLNNPMVIKVTAGSAAQI